MEIAKGARSGIGRLIRQRRAPNWGSSLYRVVVGAVVGADGIGEVDPDPVVDAGGLRAGSVALEPLFMVAVPLVVFDAVVSLRFGSKNITAKATTANASKLAIHPPMGRLRRMEPSWEAVELRISAPVRGLSLGNVIGSSSLWFRCGITAPLRKSSWKKYGQESP